MEPPRGQAVEFQRPPLPPGAQAALYSATVAASASAGMSSLAASSGRLSAATGGLSVRMPSR